MTFEQLLQTPWFIPLLAACATAFGGLCTFLGGVLATTIQIKSSKISKNEEEKKKVLFDYINFLKKFYLLIMELDEGDYINLKKQINTYLKEFEENIQFSIYIGKKWHKKGHDKFVKNLIEQRENCDQQIKNIINNVRIIFSNEIEAITKLV